MNKDTILCPSARCEEGAILLGIVDENSHVNLARKKLVITKEFVDIAKKDYVPETILRFSNTCRKEGCMQWSNGRCGVLELVLSSTREHIESQDHQDCPIRSQCRWFCQSGLEACIACSTVTYY